MKATPRSTLWVAFNLAGMLLYLRVASFLWVLPGEEGMPGGAGDAFYWFLYIVPILVAYLAINGMAFMAILFRALQGGSKQALLTWLVVGALWLCTVFYDHHRSYRTISPEYSQTTAAARDA